MAGESQETPGSKPDPSVLTTEQLEKGLKAERDYVDGQLRSVRERLSGIDEATTLRLRTIETVPAQIDAEVGHSKELLLALGAADRRYASAEVAHLREVDDIRFQAAERLAGRESELNALALAAAFAAQKEASAKEAEYTRIASVKSETSVADAIDKLGVLFATQTRGLGDKVDDLKDRVGRIESAKVGATESRTGLYAALGAVTGLILFALTIVGFLATRTQV